MKTKPAERLLSTSECIERTGLTHKALRVYERVGLIRPKRSESGWRGYGVEELLQLNTVVLLKAMGLSLRQICAVMHATAPHVKEILQVQLDLLVQRRTDVERAEAATRLALRYMADHGPLNVEQLCELLRSNALNSIPPALQVLLDKHMTPEQQANWRSPPSNRITALERVKDYANAQRDEVLNPLQVLANAGSTPNAPEVQRLIEHNNHLMNKFGVRNHMLTAYERDPDAFGELLNVGRETVRAAKASSQDAMALVGDVNVLSFFFRAVRESAAHKEIECILAEVEDSDIEQSSAGTSDVATRFRRVCEKYDLGEPLNYAKWAPTQYAGMDDSRASHALGWSLIRKALESHSE